MASDPTKSFQNSQGSTFTGDYRKLRFGHCINAYFVRNEIEDGKFVPLSQRIVNRDKKCLQKIVFSADLYALIAPYSENDFDIMNEGKSFRSRSQYGEINLHRILWHTASEENKKDYMEQWLTLEIDHKNSIRVDLRLDNLRKTCKSENQAMGWNNNIFVLKNLTTDGSASLFTPNLGYAVGQILTLSGEEGIITGSFNKNDLFEVVEVIRASDRNKQSQYLTLERYSKYFYQWVSLESLKRFWNQKSLCFTSIAKKRLEELKEEGLSHDFVSLAGRN
jgi:hypothetical protein